MAFFDWGNPYTLAGVAEATNPVDEQVMADTGALAAGHYYGFATVSASAAAQFRIERRNAANGAAVGASILVYVPAGDVRQVAFGFTLDASERIRVVMDDALTGTGVATLNYSQQT
jgi:hypothetical protein